MIEIFSGQRPNYTNSLERLVNNKISFYGLDEEILGIFIGIMLANYTVKLLRSKVFRISNERNYDEDEE